MTVAPARLAGPRRQNAKHYESINHSPFLDHAFDTRHCSITFVGLHGTLVKMNKKNEWVTNWVSWVLAGLSDMSNNGSLFTKMQKEEDLEWEDALMSFYCWEVAWMPFLHEKQFQGWFQEWVSSQLQLFCVCNIVVEWHVFLTQGIVVTYRIQKERRWEWNGQLLSTTRGLESIKRRQLMARNGRNDKKEKQAAGCKDDGCSGKQWCVWWVHRRGYRKHRWIHSLIM